MRSLSSYPNPLLRGWHFAEGVPEPTLWYRLMRRGLYVPMCAAWKVRVFNRHHEPASGGALYIANHQSFLDPMLVGMALSRPMDYMARDSLFRTPIFKQLIESVNAFPVRRGTADTGAIKEAMRRLKQGRQIVVFPEGTRTHDAKIGPFLPGVALLSQRAAEWTVPVLIEGAFEAWPRGRKLPRCGNVTVQYGPPIHRSEARSCDTEQFIHRLRQTLIDMQKDARRRAGRVELHYD